MNMMLITSLGFMLFINTIFDSIILFLRFSHGKELHWARNVLHALLIAGPVLELLGAYLVWMVYKDMRTYETPAFDHERQTLVGDTASGAAVSRAAGTGFR